MSFKLEIKNFGKLPDAEIDIGQFTVFTGPNNTGKSSVSKLLYSIFNGMNANHALVYFSILTRSLRDELIRLKRFAYEDKDFPLSVLNTQIDQMEQIIKSCSIDNFEEIEGLLKEVVELAGELPRTFASVELETKRRLRKFKVPKDLYEESLNAIKNALNELCANIEKTDDRKLLINGIRHSILRNLIQNFQVSNLSSLRTHSKNHSEVSIEGIGEFHLENGDFVNLNKIMVAGLQKLQHCSRVIYLESPVYWKLKLALERAEEFRHFYHTLEDDRLTGVPGYFHDLARALKDKRSGDNAFPELYKRLISEEVMGGELVVSEIGELTFMENGRSFPLPLTAMGVVNLGILALLVERKIIDDGTFLFIDEPEAHLHPSWQVKMAKTLFELASSGVHVVIATHSIDILKFLEVEVVKNPEVKKLIALNHFSVDGVKNYEDFDSKLVGIKEELINPFTRLYLEGL